MKLKRQQKRLYLDTSGFTLMEVMVAVVVLGLAYVAILQNFSLSLRNIDKIRTKLENTRESVRTFENQLVEMETGDAGIKAEEPYLEGNQWKLIPITSEDGTLFTLVLAAK